MVRSDYLIHTQSVLRLLTPLGMSYAAAKKRAEPSTKSVEELPQMRREAVQLVRQAVGAGRRAYVLVNNRAEGNVPLTVEGLVGMLQEEIFDGSRLGAFRWLADIWLSGGWSFPRFW